MIPRSYESQKGMPATCAPITYEYRPPEQVSQTAMITEQICDCLPTSTGAKVAELAVIFPTEDVLKMTTIIRIWSRWMDSQTASDAAHLLLFPGQKSPTQQETTLLITTAEAILRNGSGNSVNPQWLNDIANRLAQTHPAPATELAELAHLLLSAGFGTAGIRLLSHLLHSHPVEYHQIFKDDPSYWVQLAANFKNTESDVLLTTLLDCLSAGIAVENLPSVFVILQLVVQPQLKTHPVIRDNRDLLADYLLDHPQFLASLPHMLDYVSLKKITRQKLSSRLTADYPGTLLHVQQGDYDIIRGAVGPGMGIADAAIALHSTHKPGSSNEAKVNQIIKYAPEPSWRFITTCPDHIIDPEMLQRWISVRTDTISISTKHAHRILHAIRNNTNARQILSVLSSSAAVIKNKELVKKVANFQTTENRLREITNYGKIQNPLPRATKRAFSLHLPALIAMCWGNADRQQDHQRETLLRTISMTLDNDALIITELMQSARDREMVFINMLEFSHSQASPLAMEYSLAAIKQLSDQQLEQLSQRFGRKGQRAWQDFIERQNKYTKLTPIKQKT